jgi:membrane protease YdiL (CAAX protease family)
VTDGDLTPPGDRAEPLAPARPSRGSGDVPRGRLFGWLVLVGVLATLSYAANLSETDQPDDLLYRWSSAVAGAIQYGVILVVVLFLVRGIDRAVLGLQRPPSWGRALALVAAGYVTIIVVGFFLNVFLKAGDEQGLVPDEWDPDRAAPFLANFLVVVAVAPFVEELAYRGLGFAAVRSAWGSTAAILITSVAFGLAHGLVVALPILAIFGLVLAVVRQRARSVYPAMVLHAVFNGIALIAAVTVVEGGT